MSDAALASMMAAATKVRLRQAEDRLASLGHEHEALKLEAAARLVSLSFASDDVTRMGDAELVAAARLCSSRMQALVDEIARRPAKENLI